MSKDSKRFPERPKTRNYRRIIADTSQRFADASQIKKYRRMFGDCSAYIPRLVADHRRIFAEHFSRQNIANGSWKILKQALKILDIGEMLPHEYHEFRFFAEGLFIPPEHRLMLVNFHRECIGDAKKAQWDRGISTCLNDRNVECYIGWSYFLTACANCPNCSSYLNSIDQATLAILTAIKTL